ncbi:unnamed protein product, partial [Mesorhabditis belari]|uniref:Uncharacterized protein n=1 Tax=Mesorhabditis belari TaxID=2138241 RepID=A0AAF3EKG2_9BILA
MREVPPGGRVDVSPFCRSDFLTLLNFIYPTRMPIYRQRPQLEELVYRACQAGTWMQMIDYGNGHTVLREPRRTKICDLFIRLQMARRDLGGRSESM